MIKNKGKKKRKIPKKRIDEEEESHEPKQSEKRLGSGKSKKKKKDPHRRRRLNRSLSRRIGLDNFSNYSILSLVVYSIIGIGNIVGKNIHAPKLFEFFIEFLLTV